MLLKDKRIFYIEDDTKNRVIVQTILEHAGAIVGFHRWGGGDLFDRMEEFAPVDAILLDLSLPAGLTGYDVIGNIQMHGGFEGVPVVAVSALDPSIEIPKTRSKGFAGFIGKPIHLIHFPQQIASMIAGAHVWE